MRMKTMTSKCFRAIVTGSLRQPFLTMFLCRDEDDEDDEEDDDEEEEDIEDSPVKARLCFGSSVCLFVSVFYQLLFFRIRRKQHHPNRNHQLRMGRVLNLTPPHRSRWLQ